MIRHLSVSNYVLIDSLELDLSEGLNIFTGETGSGKSIFLGALALAMGERADTKVLLDKSKKCIVELEVMIGGLDLESYFVKNDLEYIESSVLRRQIDGSGRSRAFVNDTPVKLEVLREIARRVVHVHSQHNNTLLSSKAFQFDLIDRIAGADRASYSSMYREWKSLNAHLDSLREKEKNASLDDDYYRFQLAELEKADLKEDELEELERRTATLENAEELKELGALVSPDVGPGILTALEEFNERLSKAGRLSNILLELSERSNSALLEIQELISELDNELSDVELDPAEQEALRARLDTIYGLQHKHRVSSISDLISLKEEIASKVVGLGDLEDEIRNTERKIDELNNDLKVAASELSEVRTAAVSEMRSGVTTQLQKLGMPSAQFDVAISNAEHFNAYGIDNIELLFTANKGVETMPMSKVASGGELSRIMLVLTSMMTDADGLPTVIFDEIDTGVSGDVAARVGSKMQEMSSGTQVLCITHLPQIAAKATAHYKVERDDDGEISRTAIRLMNDESRVNELAEMLSGKDTTEAALANARSLIG